MTITFENIALELKKLGKDRFLRMYSQPFLAQMRDYQTAVCQRDLSETCRIDMNMLRGALGQMSERQKYPWEVIPLAHKQKEDNPSRPLSLGRGDHNDIVLDLPLLSKTHAYFRYNERDRDYQIADAGSTNETRLNFQPLKPKEWHSLRSGDLICLGGAYNYIFYYPERICLLLTNYLKSAPTGQS